MKDENGNEKLQDDDEISGQKEENLNRETWRSRQQ